MLDERFADRFAEYLGELIEPHHRVLGQHRNGTDHCRQPAPRLRGRPRRGRVLPSDASSTASASMTRSCGPRRSARWSASPRSPTSTRRWRSPTAPASACLRRSTPSRPSAVFSLPPAHQRRHGQRQQLDVRCRGAPAFRRQRPVRATGAAQSGKWVLDQMTRWQSMNWDYSGHLQKAQMDTDAVRADRGFRLEAEPPAQPGRPRRQLRPCSRRGGSTGRGGWGRDVPV